MVFTCPQFGHGECFDINRVPQLPQYPPWLGCLCEEPVERACGAPHDAHIGEPDEIMAPQLVQALPIN